MLRVKTNVVDLASCQLAAILAKMSFPQHVFTAANLGIKVKTLCCGRDKFKVYCCHRMARILRHWSLSPAPDYSSCTPAPHHHSLSPLLYLSTHLTPVMVRSRLYMWIQHGPSLYSGLLAEYTYLCYLLDDTYPLSSLSPPVTCTSVDSRDSQVLQDSYLPRTCQRTETQSESQRTVHNTS